MLLKKLVLIFTALLMAGLNFAEEKNMVKLEDTIQLNSGFNMPILGKGDVTAVFEILR